MSTQGAVDVLAVLDSVIQRSGHVVASDVVKARAAVAELIEAAADFKNKGTFEAEERLDAALARVQGGAA